MTETLMVIVFVTAIFTFIYISVIPLIGNYNDKIVRESDIDIVYKAYSIRKALNKDNNKDIMTDDKIENITCKNFSNKNYCNELMKALELDNYIFLYTKSIKDNFSDIKNIDGEIGEYIEKYKEDDGEAIILLDKNKHTIVHLNFIDADMKLGDLIIHEAKEKTCNPIFTDTDGIKYFSGTNECIDFNYVWYSGKLWRITSIYPDGAVKMITENIITTIYYNLAKKTDFYTDENTKSYAYQWLNEEFYDTLYNASNLIDSTKKWDIASASRISNKPTTPINISGNVGLLSGYEYYNAYRNVSMATNYLNIDYDWWTLTPYSTEFMWAFGNNTNISSPTNSTNGIRPSIVIKSDVEFTGSGTVNDPYKIVGDKPIGNVNDLINTRLSGEYIKLKNGDNEQVFRIIGVDDNKTKIIAMDYADNGLTHSFATNTGSYNAIWGNGATTEEGTWYTYLNTPTTGYYATLQSTYGDLFTSGTYYLGITDDDYKNVKSVSNTFNIGLAHFGEMFSTQQKWNNTSSHGMWLINRCSTIRACAINVVGSSYDALNRITSLHAARPTLYLKSTVKIKSGSGTEQDPYVIGL